MQDVRNMLDVKDDDNKSQQEIPDSHHWYQHGTDTRYAVDASEDNDQSHDCQHNAYP